MSDLEDSFSQDSRSRVYNFFITQYNMSCEQFRLVLENLGANAYAYQMEACPTTGRHHIQGYFHLPRKERCSALNRFFPTSRLRNCIDPKAAWTYCTKEETRVEGPFTLGKPPFKGQRSDLDQVAHHVLDNGNVTCLLEDAPGMLVQYGRRFEQLLAYKAELDYPLFSWRDVVVHVYWGPTDTGKTRRSVEDAEGSIGEIASYNPLWFDSYSRQKVLLLDEFTGQIPIETLLKILDGYTRNWQIKGGWVRGVWTKVCITSNIDPQDWYGTCPYAQRQALFRRITAIIPT